MLNEYQLYFCTFTCYKWLPLFQISNTYQSVYKWFEYLKSKGWHVTAYVIMPNHLHVIIYFPQPDFDLAKIIANAKRFMAYDIIKAMKVQNCTHVLNELAADLTQREKDKGQLHKVFEIVQR